jgi:hypothetical protein
MEAGNDGVQPETDAHPGGGVMRQHEETMGYENTPLRRQTINASIQVLSRYLMNRPTRKIFPSPPPHPARSKSPTDS